MFAVQCSFCQHENVPGARFCAECGSPLHLRVCPNPQCGKVSDVNAVRCEFCGTPFPKIALAEPGAAEAQSAGSPERQTSAEDAPPADERKPPASPWPLVAVAIVAGGLPLLWFNRASLPTPKTWQTSPEVERLIAPAVLPPPAAAPPQAAAAAPPPPATVAPTPQPVAAPGAESLTLPPISAPIQPAAADKAEPAETDAGAKKTEAKTPAQEKPKARRDPGDRKSRPAEAADAARPCTEAAAALGLCAAKPTGK